MAMIIIDGFDYKPDDITGTNPIYFPWTRLSTVAIAAARSRFSYGSAAVGLNNANLDYYLTSGQRDTTLVMGFAHYQRSAFPAQTRINLYTDVGANIQVYFLFNYNTTRGVQAMLGNNTQLAISNPNVLQLDAWQYIECKAFLSNSAASGYVEVRVDGVTVLSATAKTNNNATVLLWDRITLPNFGSVTGTSNNTSTNLPAIDDFYLLNAVQSGNIDFLGDVHIDTYVPVASGMYTQFTPSVGTNWSTVDEIPLNTGDYNSATVSGSIDTFVFSSLPDFTSKIFAVELIDNVGKTGSQLRQVAPIIVYSGITATGIYKAIPQNAFIYQSQIFDQNPVTASGWTPSGVVGSQFGYSTT